MGWVGVWNERVLLIGAAGSRTRCGPCSCQGTPDDWPAARGRCDRQRMGRANQVALALVSGTAWKHHKDAFPRAPLQHPQAVAGLARARQGSTGRDRACARHRLALRAATSVRRGVPESGPSTARCQAIGRQRLRPRWSLNLACVRDAARREHAAAVEWPVNLQAWSSRT